MALLIIIVYALPNLRVSCSITRTCVVATTVLMGSAFGSENFMSGINTIGVGQIEAARSIGLSFGQILRKIVIPQALRTTVLPMTNLLIAVMLTTALGSPGAAQPARAHRRGVLCQHARHRRHPGLLGLRSATWGPLL